MIIYVWIVCGPYIMFVMKPGLTPEDEAYFQFIGVDARNRHSKSGWWHEDDEDFSNSDNMDGIPQGVRALARTPGTALNRTYGNTFINACNRTVFVVLTDISPENIAEIDLSYTNAHFVYKEAPATYWEPPELSATAKIERKANARTRIKIIWNGYYNERDPAHKIEKGHQKSSHDHS